jgi:8-oxo-dGTP pyrophosphatase MutT (NUDIX family)
MKSIVQYLIPDKERKYNSADLVDYQAVAAVIKDKDGKILMQKHNKYGFWTIPVGKVEPGQTLEDGLRQEVREECNIVLTKYKQIIQRNFKYIRLGNKIDVDTRIFEVYSYTGKVKNNEPQKHSIQKFLTVDEIAQLDEISHVTQLYLEHLGKLPDRLNNLDKIK